MGDCCRQYHATLLRELRTLADEIEKPFIEARGFEEKVGLFHKKKRADSIRAVCTIIETIEPD
jgi:hypothetical protein